MALIPCPECGRMVSPNAEECPHCGAPIKELLAKQEIDTPVDNQRGVPATDSDKPLLSQEEQFPEKVLIDKSNGEEPVAPQVVPAKDAVMDLPQNKTEKKKVPIGIIILIISLLFVASGVGIWFYYTNVYLPEKRDAEAPRYYVMAQNINMRSSPEFEADYNKIGSFPYGTEIIVYDSVKTGLKPYLYGKYAPRDAKGKVIKEKVVEGYLAYDYMATKADFFMLNSIFGNDDARKMLSESRYKKALLDYFKKNHYKGNISRDKMIEYGINPNATQSWQVFCRHEKATSNNVYRSRKYKKDSKYPDLAVIIKNINGYERRLLYFVFDDDETFRLLLQQPAPYSGYMKDRTLKLKNADNGGYYVEVEYE